MSKDVREVLEDALSLSPADRASLADSLLESLDGQISESCSAIEPDVEEYWRVEAQKRASELDSGAVQGVPWPEVYAGLQSRLKR